MPRRILLRQGDLAAKKHLPNQVVSLSSVHDMVPTACERRALICSGTSVGTVPALASVWKWETSEVTCQMQ